jgi:hypothetical protein
MVWAVYVIFIKIGDPNDSLSRNLIKTYLIK